jgi:hypothetical protein
MSILILLIERFDIIIKTRIVVKIGVSSKQTMLNFEYKGIEKKYGSSLNSICSQQGL